MIYLAVPSPFLLPTPSKAWLQPIADYDIDLRIYPSRKDYVYRLARVARRSGPMNKKLFAELPSLHPDTKVCLDHGLVAVTTIPVAAIYAPPENIVKQLVARDMWRHGGADAVADLMDQRDALAEAKVDAEIQDNLRARSRAMYVGYQHRTGARVSLVSRRRPQPAISSLETPGAS